MLKRMQAKVGEFRHVEIAAVDAKDTTRLTRRISLGGSWYVVHSLRCPL
jgi:hypothetical protein